MPPIAHPQDPDEPVAHAPRPPEVVLEQPPSEAPLQVLELHQEARALPRDPPQVLHRVVVLPDRPVPLVDLLVLVQRLRLLGHVARHLVVRHLLVLLLQVTAGRPLQVLHGHRPNEGPVALPERHREPFGLLEPVEPLLPELVELDRLLEPLGRRPLQLNEQEPGELRDGEERAVPAFGVHLPLLLPLVVAVTGHHVPPLLLVPAVPLVVPLLQQPFTDVLDALAPLPRQLGPLLTRPLNP